MASIRKITTGFHAADLFSEGRYDERASANNYAALVHTLLCETYPGVEIVVRYDLHTSGTLPHDLTTQVFFVREGPADVEGTAAQECDIARVVADIKLEVYTEQWDEWAVDATEED